LSTEADHQRQASAPLRVASHHQFPIDWFRGGLVTPRVSGGGQQLWAGQATQDDNTSTRPISHFQVWGLQSSACSSVLRFAFPKCREKCVCRARTDATMRTLWSALRGSPSCAVLCGPSTIRLSFQMPSSRYHQPHGSITVMLVPAWVRHRLLTRTPPPPPALLEQSVLDPSHILSCCACQSQGPPAGPISP
jgi:hypothetical protein